MKIAVDTAVVLPVNCLPLTDDTDFKSRETAVAYNAAGMDLVWNFVTTAGVTTQTAVTPTTGGVYDWAHLGDGIYTIEIPASGGASINNNAEGFGWFTGLATGVLSWASPIYEFIPAAIANALVNGTDRLDANVTHAAGTAWGSGAVTAAALAADAANEIADAILLRSVSNTEGSAGEHTLTTVILATLESSRSGTTWTIKRTDGTTTHATKTLTLNAAADLVTGVT